MSLLTDNHLIQKCRICFSLTTDVTSFFAPIYREENSPDSRWFSLAEILQSVATVEIEMFDELTEQVCEDCIKRIVDFKDFLNTFQKNQLRLHDMVQNRPELEETEEGPISKIEICEFTKSEENFEEVSNGETLEITNDDVCDSNSVYENIKNDCDSESVSLVEEETDQKSRHNTIDCLKYSCDECGDCFLIKSGFSQHMMQKHQMCIQLEDFKCYSSQISIKMPDGYTENVLKYVPKAQQPQKINKYECRLCKSVFSSESEFKSHKEVHRTHKCELCGAAFTKNSYLKDHLLVHSSAKLFACDVCKKTFKYRNGLSVHKTVHENFRGHICDTCGQGFNARSTLYTHIRLKHQIEKKFPCPNCQLSFKEKSWLNKHILRKHSGTRTKDFVCSVCGIAYLNKYTLDRHMFDKHVGTPKRYYCTICDKSYTMKNKLNSHLEKKHFLAVDLKV